MPQRRRLSSDEQESPTVSHNHRSSLERQSARLSNIQSRLHNLRTALTNARRSDSFLHDHINATRRARISTPPHVMSTSPISESRRRMRSVLRRIRENEGSPTGRRSESPGATAAPPPERRRAMPSERYQRLGEQRLRRVRRFFEQDNGSREGLHDLQEASERLAQSNEDLRNMLDRPTAESPPGLFVEHVDESERRRKRRRTESWRPSELSLPRVEYGQKGQVDSGCLKMEIVSSDGGNMGPSTDLQANWSGLGLNGVENILEDDKNVYSAGSRRSNIVLQHQGERPFTMSKLVVKASPGSSTDSLLEGLVFVTTKKDSTFDRTTQYQIHHYPTSQFGPRARVADNTLSLPQNVARLLRNSSVESDNHPSVASYHPTTHSRPQTSQPGADCDATSDSSDADRTPRPQARRARQVVISPTSSDADSSSDDSPAQTSSTRSSRRSPPPHAAGSGHWTHNRLLRNPFRDLSVPPPAADDDDDYENVLAQFDFDEVLRRGNVVAHDRRRRRRDQTRDRVARRRIERENHAAPDPFLRPPELDATQLGIPISPLEGDGDRDAEDDVGPDGTGSDVPGEDALAQTEENSLFADLAALTESSPLRHSDNTPSDFALLPVTASFISPTSGSSPVCRRHAHCSKTIQSPGPPIPRAGAATTPGTGVRVTAVRKAGGRRVTVRFDPPVAARYVLLKLWRSGRRGRGDGYGGGMNGGPEGGVEVQRVRVEGWCGPRFHQAIEMA